MEIPKDFKAARTTSRGATGTAKRGKIDRL